MVFRSLFWTSLSLAWILFFVAVFGSCCLNIAKVRVVGGLGFFWVLFEGLEKVFKEEIRFLRRRCWRWGFEG